jgi:predicted AAA+ superfamily ATPase
MPLWTILTKWPAPFATRSGSIPRSLERTLRRAAREFPVVVLTGPRQSGKTTLLSGFLALHAPPVILDGIQ